MASRPPRYRRRSVVDYSDAQTGDVSSGDAAGRDIHHDGADADELLKFLRDYVFLDRQEREIRQGDLDRRLRRLEIWLIVLTATMLAQAIRTFELQQIVAWIGV